jgi:outer membrane protein assembly factor BamB
VLLFDGGGIAGYDLKTGAELWQYPWEAFRDMNIAQPILPGDDRVFLSSEAGSGGCAMLKITRAGTEFRVEKLWESAYLAAKQANPVRMGNAIFGLHLGTLVCLDVDTGQRYWRGKWFGQGQILGVAGTLLIQSEQGELVAVAADRRRYQELGRMKVFAADRSWNTPALAGRYLFLRNDVEMACYELPVRE